MEKDGIKLDPRKVEAMTAWLKPTTMKEVQQFLGLTNFFRKCILGYADLAAPMVELTKKDAAWSWANQRELSFQQLKLALTEAPVLAIPDPAAPFELITDSSGYGLGAVLMQHNRPMAFYSRRMTAAERNYVNHEQGLLAAIIVSLLSRYFAATCWELSST